MKDLLKHKQTLEKELKQKLNSSYYNSNIHELVEKINEINKMISKIYELNY